MKDLISREALLQRITGPERPEIYDGAQEVEWIERCIREAPPASIWKPGAEPPEDERSVIAQYHFVGHPGMVFTSVLSYFAHDPKPHWQHGGGGVLIVDRWMPIPPTQEGGDQ